MAVRLGIGLGRFSFESTHAFRRWLDACEEGPIDSIWQSDQVLSQQPSPEPLSLLAMVAGATERLKIGMNAVVIGFRDPVTFARQCASIDYLSGGRLLPVVGVGAGNSPAWRATGRTPKGRGHRANEALEIITRLWREEAVTFSGDHFRVEDATITPRPVQCPLPLWIGGASPAAVRRTVRYGNGWLGGLQTADEAKATAAAIRVEATARGRAIPDDHYGATFLYRIESGSGSDGEVLIGEGRALQQQVQRVAVSGTAEEIVEHLRGYVAGGITKFVAIPIARSEAEFIEQTRLLAEEVVPVAMAIEA